MKLADIREIFAALKTRPLRATVSLAAVVVVVALGATFKGFFGEKGKQIATGPPIGGQQQVQEQRASERFSEELIAILENRAASIKRDIEAAESLAEARHEAVSATQLAATRVAFMELHNQHVQALRAGQVVLAHELLREIYALLSFTQSIEESLTFGIDYWRTGAPLTYQDS